MRKREVSGPQSLCGDRPLWKNCQGSPSITAHTTFAIHPLGGRNHGYAVSSPSLVKALAGRGDHQVAPGNVGGMAILPAITTPHGCEHRPRGSAARGQASGPAAGGGAVVPTPFKVFSFDVSRAA